MMEPERETASGKEEIVRDEGQRVLEAPLSSSFSSPPSAPPLPPPPLTSFPLFSFPPHWTQKSKISCVPWSWSTALQQPYLPHVSFFPSVLIQHGHVTVTHHPRAGMRPEKCRDWCLHLCANAVGHAYTNLAVTAQRLPGRRGVYPSSRVLLCWLRCPEWHTTALSLRVQIKRLYSEGTSSTLVCDGRRVLNRKEGTPPLFAYSEKPSFGSQSAGRSGELSDE